MLDIRWIVDNLDKFNESLLRRGVVFDSSEIVDLYSERKRINSEMEELLSKRNSLAKEIGKIKSQKGNADKEMKLSMQINEEIENLQSKGVKEIDEKLNFILSTLPNIVDFEIPKGKSDEDNIEVNRVGSMPSFDFPVKAHYDLGEASGDLDFEQAGKVFGSRSSILSGNLALLERALSNYFLDFLAKKGFIEISAPFLTKENALFGTGQLPKFADDAYQTTDGMWLIPTSEVSLTNLVADKLLKEEELPIRFCAYTPCYRKEAGSAGRDTRGLIRQHQFKKVEMVCITTQDQSAEEHERMIKIESEMLSELGLPFRLMLLCDGDLGFSANKSYDHEVWLPSQETFREITSCSNCGDFQARRINARYKEKDSKKNKFVHTLNGSALAIGRTIVAIMENFQQKDGSIKVPQLLQKYMNGAEFI